MPYYRWEGITLFGDIKKGKTIALNQQQLARDLFQQGIGLIWAKETWYYASSISLKEKSRLFAKIAQLLHAGLRVPEACTLAAQYGNNPLLTDTLFAQVDDITKGISFSDIMKSHNALYDDITKAVLLAGEESGQLSSAFAHIAQYYHDQYEYRKKLLAALSMPLITLSFFFLIMIFILVFIVPRFVEVFSAFNNQLPFTTQCIISLSVLVRSSYVFVLAGVLVLLMVGLKYYYKTHSYIVNKIPGIKTFFLYNDMHSLFSALALLSQGGVSVVDSLSIVCSSASYSSIHDKLAYLYNHVQSGKMLSDALQSLHCFHPEAIALIRIGEESGYLRSSFERVAHLYHDILEEKRARFILIVQPLMIIMLGFLILFFVVALYAPILNVSHGV